MIFSIKSFDLILVVTVTLCLFYGYYILVSATKNKTAKFLFISLLLSFPIISIYKILVFSGFVNNFSDITVVLLFMAGEYIYWAQPPLIFLFISTLIIKSYRLSYISFTHLIPIVLYIGFISVHFVYIGLAASANSIRVFDIYSNSFFYSLNLMMTIVLLIYLGLAAKNIAQYKRLLIQNFSNRIDINVDWLGLLIICFQINFVARILALTSGLLGMSDLAELLGFGTTYIEFIIVCSIIYGIHRYHPLTEKIISPKSESIATPATTKYDPTTIKENIIQLKLYQNSKVSLGDIANTLNISPKSLLRVIENEREETFYDYINCIRIQVAKNLLEKRVSELDIVEQCGFASRTIFKYEFNKKTGRTILDFKKSLMLNMESN